MRKSTFIIFLVPLLSIVYFSISSGSNINNLVTVENGTREDLNKYRIPSELSDDKVIQKLEGEKKAGTLNAMGFNLLGHIYEVKNRYAEAIENYKQAIEIDPQYIEVYNSLGLVYEYSNLTNKERLSVATLEKGLELCKKNPGKFDCTVLIQNLASDYLVYKIYSDTQKNMLNVIKYSEEGLRIVDKEKNIQYYTRFYYLLGEAYSNLSGKENLIKAVNAYKEVIKYKSSPWYEKANNNLFFVEQELRLKDKRKDKQGNSGQTGQTEQ